MCAGTDPTNMLKILIGPVICFILLLFVAGAGFVVFKKKYAIPTNPHPDIDTLFLAFDCLKFVSFFPFSLYSARLVSLTLNIYFTRETWERQRQHT